MSREAGEYLRKHGCELAAKITRAHFHRYPEHEARYGPVGREKCLQDTAYHLSNLAEAVIFQAPGLFQDYVRWARQLLAAYKIPVEDLIRNLELIREILGEEMPQALKEIVRPYLDRVITDLVDYPSELPSYILPTSPLASLASEYLQNLISGHGSAGLSLILRKLQDGTSLPAIYEHVIIPCLREVGRLWQTRAITEAQEHYCSHITDKLMTLLSSYFDATRQQRRMFLGFCVGNEQHDLGIRIIGDAFEMAGWNVVHLGANVPPKSLPGALRLWRPEVVGISVTMTSHLGDLEKALAVIRREPLNPPPKIIVGGRPFSSDKSLWTKFDVTGAAENAQEALQLAV